MDHPFHSMPGLETEGSKLAVQQAMHSQYVLQFLQLQRHAGFLCDITVNIQERSFRAHKPLLAACSLYFRALFADSETSKTSTLNFEKLTASGFEVLLDYIYSGSLAITSENSNQVLHAANCLQMINVVETCLNFIRSSFKVTTGDPTRNVVQCLDAEVTQPQVAESFHTPPDSIHVVPSALQPSVPERTTLPLTDHADRRNLSHGVRYPQVLPEHSSRGAVYPPSSAVFQSQQQNHVPKTHISASQQAKPDQSQPLSQHLLNPSPKTVGMHIPYLNNTRRPTLNEVKQLLLSGGQHPVAGILPDTDERISMPKKQPLPLTYIFTGEASARLHAPSNELTYGQFHPGTNAEPESETISLDVAVSRSTDPRSTRYSVDGNTANRATVRAAERLHPNDSLVTSKETLPTVLMTSQNDAVDLVRSSSKPGDGSSKGGAWCDDRSVKSDRIATHLSGTPCDADLTRIVGSASTVAWSRETTSPVFSALMPSVEISPESEKASRSPTNSNAVPKVRLLHAHSLELPVTSVANDYAAAEDFRSTSLSPRFFSQRNSASFQQPLVKNRRNSNGDRSALISAERAVNAVGALFVDSVPGKTRSPTSSTATQSSVDDDARLVIEEASDDSAKGRASDRSAEKSETQADRRDLYEIESDSKAALGSNITAAKTETDWTPPPADDVLNGSGQNVVRSHSPDMTAINSHNGTIDESGILDLSVRRRSTETQSTATLPSHAQPTLTRPTEVSMTTALYQPAQEASIHDVPPPQADAACFLPSTASAVVDDASLSVPAVYSRKPRRSSGGQTCNWPGCGRLFRHPNIFEEHVKQHRRGVPVKQLKRCYMGARVKKTARERLDEMRMTDGTAAAPQTSDDGEQSAGAACLQRLEGGRKRPGAAYPKRGVDRKRVSTRDRKEHGTAQSLHWQQPCAPLSTAQRTPVYSHTPGTLFYSRAPGTPMYNHAPGTSLAVLQAVSSQRPAMNEVARTATMNLLGNALTTEARPQQSRLAPQPELNKSAVQETLAALGIPMPNTRDDKDSSTLIGVSKSTTAFTHPTRSALSGAGSETKRPHGALTLPRLIPYGILTAPTLSPHGAHTAPSRSSHCALTAPSQQRRTGNVTGSMDSKPSESSYPAPADDAQASLPISYHGTVHGPKCS